MATEQAQVSVTVDGKTFSGSIDIVAVDAPSLRLEVVQPAAGVPIYVGDTVKVQATVDHAPANAVIVYGPLELADGTVLAQPDGNVYTFTAA